LAATVALLSGCASGSGSSGEEDPAPPGGRVLTVLSFEETYLPREAYLAKFEVVEGSAALLYPTRERDIEPIGPGTHRLPALVPPFIKSQRDLYSPRATGLLNSPPNRIVEVTVLAVISDQPLNLEPFLRSPRGLRDHLLEAGATTEQAILAEILRTVVVDPQSVAWESDARLVRWSRRD
jgi:hypothetical protein